MRGVFFEYFNQSGFQEVSGNATTFVQDNFSFIKKMGAQRVTLPERTFAQAKLIRVLRGEIFDVVVDLRKKKKRLENGLGLDLMELIIECCMYLRVRPRISFLSDKTELLYKCSSYFKKEAERTLHWSDSAIRISWPSEIPISNMIISEKDQEGLSLDRLLELDELF